MLELRELTVTGIVLRILVSVVLGGIIGMERGMKNRPAGLRTYMLVCVGACVVMMINQFTYQVYGTGDPVRLGAQVVSGIGFLGAGTIIVTSHNQIKGLTTAAGLWASACIGLAIGIGLYEVALVGGAAVFLSLTVLHEWDFYMRSKTRVIDAYIELEPGATLGSFLRNARDCDLAVSDIQLEREPGFPEEATAFLATVKGKKKMSQIQLIQTLKKMEGVKYLEVL
ncbi:MAG: MgtC/SapB family protein [Firmicutes bacterium]|nr:MgtC/SapB family protein [Bacillota bacterium]